MCPEPNGLFVIHVADNDIIGCAKNAKEEERIGELVGTLLAQFERYAHPVGSGQSLRLISGPPAFRMKLRPPMVIVSTSLSVCLGGKTRAVRIFPADPTQQAVFKKNGNDIDLICHNMTTV